MAGLENNVISRQERRITIMLLFSSFGFVALILPYVGYFTAVSGQYPDPDDYTRAFFMNMNLSLHSLNFVFYCVSASNFRREVMAMFGCKVSDGRGNKVSSTGN